MFNTYTEFTERLKKREIILSLFLLLCCQIGVAQTSPRVVSTYNSQERIHLGFNLSGVEEVQFTLAPEDREVVKRNHWPIVFIDWENDGKYNREMINLTEERVFTVKARGTNTVTIYGEDGLWKLVVNQQKLRYFSVANATELRYLDVSDNALYASNNSAFPDLPNPNLQTVKCRKNRLRSIPTTSRDYPWQELDASENLIKTIDLTRVPNLSYLDLSKNLLTSVTLPEIFNTADRKLFVGGNHAAYTTNTEQLYVSKGQADTKINLTVNKLNIGTLPTLPAGSTEDLPILPANYFYTIQERYQLPQTSYDLEESIDLSSQLTAQGLTDAEQRTTFRWFIEKNADTDEYELIPENHYTEKDGVFRFIRSVGDNKKIFAAMTTEAFRHNNHPLESFERRKGIVDYNGFDLVVKQPEGVSSQSKDTYFTNLTSNELGDGLNRTLGNRFFRTTTFTLNNRNLWYGHYSNDWSDPHNWTGNRVPPTTPHEYAALTDKSESNVVFHRDAIRDLHVDDTRVVNKYINNSTKGKALIVNPGTSLTLQKASDLGDTEDSPYLLAPGKRSYRLVLRSEEDKPNGTLLLPNITSHPAVVEIFSKAIDGNRKKQKATWQYFGIPMTRLDVALEHPDIDQEKYKFPYLGDDVHVRKYDRMKSDEFDEKWVDYDITQDFEWGAAYEITQPTPIVHRFYGDIESPVQAVWNADGTDTPVNYENMNIFANSYTAAMDISRMNFTGAVEQQVYLFNTGSREDWKTNQGHTNLGESRGQYTLAIPVGLSGHVSGMPTTIPSLSSFMVKASGTGQVTYRKADLVENTTANYTQKGEYPSVRIELEGKGQPVDRLWLVEAPGTTTAYDAGFDGEKLFMAGTAQIYALQDRNYQVTSSDSIVDTDLGFIPSVDSHYTLKFNLSAISREKQLYLYDYRDEVIVPVIDGEYYRFSAKATDPVRRFALRTRTQASSNTLKDSFSIRVDGENKVWVSNFTDVPADVQIFDAAGKLLSSFAVEPNIERSHGLTLSGVYLITVKNSVGTMTRRYVLP